eukprot:CAMPEP_0117445658 /NCGR_PEP_ID=MMETSP0759-20121206/5916_1 /TAXON_ID=63605 /ORGANISM="Percolomonas cosmopolitus, Strain WS" /LENGTH=229 /DNA_ID=CAMNT_0005237855 /DNA_START=158 /DNA_END=847 /DNA_ORIENTATION=+
MPAPSKKESSKPAAAHTITTIYRNTTLGITLQQALDQFSDRHSIPGSLHEEIQDKFDKLMCEMMSNATVSGGSSTDANLPPTPVKKEPASATSTTTTVPHGALKYNLLSSAAIPLAHPDIKPPMLVPMAPIAKKASIRHGKIDMYRYVNKCYEFILNDVDVELDVSGRGQDASGGADQAQQLEEQLATSRYSLADQTIKLKSDQLKIVAIRTSDLLKKKSKSGTKRKRE